MTFAIFDPSLITSWKNCSFLKILICYIGVEGALDQHWTIAFSCTRFACS